MTPPKISVGVAVRDGAATLQRCLDSFACQTYPHKELIVIDGGSSDGSVDLLRRNAEKIAYWESEPDRGIYHAWNKALARMSGDWICFLGADDYLWADDVLERVAGALATAFPPLRVAYGQVAVVSASGQVVRRDGRDWSEARAGFVRTMTIPHPGLMHHRTLFEDHGVFDESLSIAADYDLLLRELKNGEALFIPETTVVGMRHGGVSYAPGMMSTMLAEQSLIRQKHGLPPIGDWRSTSSTLIKMRLCAFLTRCVGEDGFRSLADGYRRLTGRPAVWRESR